MVVGVGVEETKPEGPCEQRRNGCHGAGLAALSELK